MICIKFTQEERTGCPYIMPGDTGMCKANICQLSLDGINKKLSRLLKLFEHINNAAQTMRVLQTPQQESERRDKYLTDIGLEITPKQLEPKPYVQTGSSGGDPSKIIPFPTTLEIEVSKEPETKLDNPIEEKPEEEDRPVVPINKVKKPKRRGRPKKGSK